MRGEAGSSWRSSRLSTGPKNEAGRRFSSQKFLKHWRRKFPNPFFCPMWHQLILTFVQFQDLQVEREKLLVSNRSLAEDSLTRRPRLSNGKFQLAKKYRELSDLAALCWEKQSQLGELMVCWWSRTSRARGSGGEVIRSNSTVLEQGSSWQPVSPLTLALRPSDSP